ncbi:hypothetical protein [Streptomyces sp. NPDC049916]|uniref:hypothetical protein n=1 Tax=Streptomyces sp. NPDC049916 TaxID=3155156 RepID=UPI00342F87AF
MQRTTITARLLVGLAVTAASGCVSVTPPAGPPGAPRPPGTAAPVQDVAPQIVQPPAREALEVVEDAAPPAALPPAPAPPATSGARSDPGRAGPPPARDRGDPPRRAPARVPVAPPVVVPSPPALRLSGGRGADVCALGRAFGDWSPGSRQARICEQAYGR